MPLAAFPPLREPVTVEMRVKRVDHNITVDNGRSLPRITDQTGTASYCCRRTVPLDYQIVVNWVIAEHKSQGLFQMDSGKHDLEEFWLFEISGANAISRAGKLRQLLLRQNPVNSTAQVHTGAK